jgi:hypothetical protein
LTFWIKKVTTYKQLHGSLGHRFKSYILSLRDLAQWLEQKMQKQEKSLKLKS